MADVLISIYAVNGRSLAFRVPFETMHEERDAHDAIFPEIDITPELFRRLQVRVCSALLRIMEDHISMLYPRDYFVLTKNGIDIDSDVSYSNTSLIPIAAVDAFLDNMFQVCLVKSLNDIDPDVKLVTVPLDVMHSTYENEKEDELMLYMDHHINNHFDQVNILCDEFEKLKIS
jgi:hypothetical protein